MPSREKANLLELRSLGQKQWLKIYLNSESVFRERA